VSLRKGASRGYLRYGTMGTQTWLSSAFVLLPIVQLLIVDAAEDAAEVPAEYKLPKVDRG
jgi:hypothetical protein